MLIQISVHPWNRNVYVWKNDWIVISLIRQNDVTIHSFLWKRPAWYADSNICVFMKAKYIRRKKEWIVIPLFRKNDVTIHSFLWKRPAWYADSNICVPMRATCIFMKERRNRDIPIQKVVMLLFIHSYERDLHGMPIQISLYPWERRVYLWKKEGIVISLFILSVLKKETRMICWFR